MTNRIVDVGSAPVRLSVRNGQLVVAPEGGEPSAVALTDISVLMLSHPAVVLSAAVLAELTACGGSIVFCGPDRMPGGMVLPLVTHAVQSERHGRQVALTVPTRKRLWQQIVRAKIRAQAAALCYLGRPEPGLGPLAERVRAGDASNAEAQAAVRYWPVLFDDRRFRRGSGYEGRNACLNYGYAVLRAGVARAICAAGLHPSLGLRHHNRYDPFCLASDLMEPFRPLVDIAVAKIAGQIEIPAQLDPRTKRDVLEFWSERYLADGERRALADILQDAADSLARVVLGREKNLAIPAPAPAEARSACEGSRRGVASAPAPCASESRA